MVLQKIKNVTRTKYDGTKTVAVVLIRGLIGLAPDIKKTLDLLTLRKKHRCVLLKNKTETMRMLFKVKDYIAYGEVSDETVKNLQEKRGQKNKEGKLKSYYNLAPPKGGFERKGIKKPYAVGGALGYRGKEMSALIEKML